MRERELLEAKNILYKVDRMSLTIICLRISVYETTRLYMYYIFTHNYKSVKERGRRCQKNRSQELARSE